MKIVTWNIQWCRGVDGRVDPRRIVEHVRAFAADVDVLCLQEVASGFTALGGSAGEDQFAELAALLPGYAAIDGVAVDHAGEGGVRRRFGNMILSRLPVTSVERVRLPWPADDVRRSMPRLLLEATVAAPFGPLRMMTTHLEYYSAAQRAAQVEAIRARHAEASRHATGEWPHDATEEPFRSPRHTISAVLTGDFNFRPSDPLHARLTAAFEDNADGDDAASVPPFIDAWQHLHPAAAQPPTAGVHDHAQWPEAFACDFVCVSADLLPRLRSIAVDGATAASDHQPMVLELG